MCIYSPDYIGDIQPNLRIYIVCDGGAVASGKRYGFDCFAVSIERKKTSKKSYRDFIE